MGKSIKKRFLSEPRLLGLLIGALFLLLGYWTYYDYQYGDGRVISHRYSMPYEFYFHVGAYCTIYYSFHHSILPKGIGLHFFCIPVGLIKWEKVEMAEYVYRWNLSESKSDTSVNQQGIFVMFRNCREFYDPHGDSLILFLFKHPFSCAFIRFPKYKRRMVVKLFQSYFPNLTFQVGCDTGFLNEEEQ